MNVKPGSTDYAIVKYGIMKIGYSRMNVEKVMLSDVALIQRAIKEGDK